MTVLLLEKLSMAMEEGTILAWLVADGAEVSAGQPIVEIETDKATEIVEAPADGAIRLLVQEGEIVPVDTPIAEIGGGGGATAGAAAPTRETTAVEPPPAAPVVRPAAGGGASPAAKSLARKLGVDIHTVTGTGPGGRIVHADIERAAQAGSAEVSPSSPARGLRDAVVASLTASWREIPHIHIGGELVADGLAEARRRLVDRAGPRVTATDLLIIAVARALRDVPDLNGHVGAHGAATRSSAINLALAVATDQGIVAPVMAGADALSLDQVAAERARLVEAARAGTVDRRDLGSATCTLSNLGTFPVDFFAPVISGPQIALIATGRMRQVPVAVDGLVGVGSRMWVNASIDHRGADGEAGGRFLAALERHMADLPDIT